MQQRSGILFIVNPTSGVRSKADIPGLIKTHITQHKYEIAFTEFAGHATHLARQAAQDGYKIVVAVGGDGTVNETARGLLGTEAALAILPKGSGNGLARHLTIPLRLPLALQVINQGVISKIDTCSINGHPFFTTAGIGFDAYISGVFARNKRRGLRTYVELILKEFFSYKAHKAELKLVNQTVTSENFVIAFGNASQYGNNAYITPMADIRDGKMDICLVQQLNMMQAIEVGYGLMSKKLGTSRYARYFSSNKAEVTTEKPLMYHADGEFIGEADHFLVELYPLSLHVVIPEINGR